MLIKSPGLSLLFSIVILFLVLFILYKNVNNFQLKGTEYQIVM